ncbi:hypothetical protein [Shimazuella kribbensis]|uniref:hypothetical protein n=1 Tax=Shimazuella kribbensis TaxID=139808 RepID=UPI000412CA5C|nr:hypothetical protein [Shimazuella kribbensis]
MKKNYIFPLLLTVLLITPFTMYGNASQVSAGSYEETHRKKDVNKLDEVEIELERDEIEVEIEFEQGEIEIENENN